VLFYDMILICNDSDTLFILFETQQNYKQIPATEYHSLDTTESLHLTILTLCLDSNDFIPRKGVSNLVKCIDDSDVVATATSVIKGFDGTHRRVTFDRTSIQLSSDTSLSLAVRSAAMSHDTGRVTLNSTTLADWLSHSSTISSLLSKSKRKPFTRHVALIVFQIPDDNSLPESVTFDSISNKNSLIVDTKLSIDMVEYMDIFHHTEVKSTMDDRFVDIETLFVINPKVDEENPLHPNLRLYDFGGICLNNRLSISRIFRIAIFHTAMLRLLSYENCIGSIYFSSSANEYIYDFYWYYANLASSFTYDNRVYNSSTFLENRCIPRYIVMNTAENLIKRLHLSLDLLAQIRPMVDLLSVLSNEYSIETNINPKLLTRSKFSKNEKLENEIKVEKPKQGELLENFLTSLDSAATELSHFNFVQAESYLYDAEAQLRKIENRIDAIFRARKGDLTCADDDSVISGDKDSTNHIHTFNFSSSKMMNLYIYLVAAISIVFGIISKSTFFEKR
jgi:hypothetical protein